MRFKVAVTLLGVAALLLGLSAFSPLLLAHVDFGDADWSRAADIGQAYGAASSILSALALAGVSWTIVMQLRQNQIARVQAEEQLRVMMTRLAMSDSDLCEVWWMGGDAVSDTERKQMLFADLILIQWQTAWQIGELPDDGLRAHLGQLFRELPVARRFWAQTRPHRMNIRHSPADNRFSKIVDDVYEATIASNSGMPAAPADEEPVSVEGLRDSSADDHPRRSA
jgi:Family of unknown function (DUF6082)